ncbi:SDR family NAD(P)-dependent oxidoreductase [Kordiimonas lacus]|uniref:NAD(P)-dependent dehydrogenase, short-chain alcohol dehydrogenase family n=1 Tax=Kordiimonas lacus TaxID=637679 RepID=A0A1G7A7B1_9PROT|nr:SDR family NAD(P)-dependent oxidoreductase [Kordiimonas lacus]SDE10661.1 NAD(P)-dependent dehydrogenase, short-chain alcohol dehydrogenase family [Kordiimonas lacus]
MTSKAWASDLSGLLAESTDAAVVIGASGGIGGALLQALEDVRPAGQVIGFSRSSEGGLDLLDEATIKEAAASIRRRGVTLRLLIVATGVLETGATRAEKSLRELDPTSMLRMFQLNTVGPALVLKHFLSLVPRKGRSVAVCLSARVGSIGDNRLGGWYSYRASKTALNQLIKTASVELARKAPDAVLAALHPGTVDTPLTQPFAKTGLDVQAPDVAAGRLLRVIAGLQTADTGGFFDHKGMRIEW